MPSGEIQDLVDRLAERLRRSVVIDDVDLNMLYSSEHFGDEDPVRVEAMLKRRASAKAIGHVLAQGVLAWTRPGLIPPNAEVGLHSRVCVPIRWQGDLIALLMVMDSDGSLTTAGIADTSRVAEQVAPLLVQELQKTEDRSEGTVLDLISNDGALRRQALSELASTGTDSDVHVVAVRLSVRTRNDHASEAHTAVALRSAMMLARPTAARFQLSAVERMAAVLVLGSARPLASETVATHALRLLNRVKDLSAGQFDAAAGIGPTVMGLERAHETADLAGLAVRASEVGIAESPVLWEQLGPYGPLLRIPAAQLGPAVLPAEVQHLLEVDRDGHLLETVRAFLDAGGSAPAASSALQIHRTTLYYRLSRVEELLGVDLSDGRTRLSLHVGIALLNFLPDPRQGEHAPGGRG